MTACWQIAFLEGMNGFVAEWLGRALQKLLQQFESARNLVRVNKKTANRRFFYVWDRLQIGILVSS